MLCCLQIMVCQMVVYSCCSFFFFGQILTFFLIQFLVLQTQRMRLLSTHRYQFSIFIMASHKRERDKAFCIQPPTEHKTMYVLHLCFLKTMIVFSKSCVQVFVGKVVSMRQQTKHNFYEFTPVMLISLFLSISVHSKVEKISEPKLI